MKAILNFSKKNGKINMENRVVFHFFCLMICLTKIPLYFSLIPNISYTPFVTLRFFSAVSFYAKEKQLRSCWLLFIKRKRRNQRYAQLLLVSYLPMVNHSLHVLNTTCKIILQVKE